MRSRNFVQELGWRGTRHLFGGVRKLERDYVCVNVVMSKDARGIDMRQDYCTPECAKRVGA